MSSFRKIGANILLAIAALTTISFLLMPLSAVFGLGLYYSFGILLVADLTQMIAALGQENEIAPALIYTPMVALFVAALSCIWGLGLSLAWRRWLVLGQRKLILLSALPLILPRFGLGALFLLACLQVAQWGGNALGTTLVIISQAVVATPMVAGILCLGWKRIDPTWRMAGMEAGADEATIFRRLSWPILRPYLHLSGLLAFLMSFGDFYLGNALAGDTALLPGVLFSGVARNASPFYQALVAAVLLINAGFAVMIARRLRLLQRDERDGAS